MKIGDYITRLTGLDQYSPIFGRGGQGALFSVDVLDVPGGSVALGVEVEHKNSDDTSWVSLVVFSSITTTGVKTATATGIKEQLRFVYSVSGGGAPEVYDTFYINVLAPVWTP
jgi:hypothetical protein